MNKWTKTVLAAALSISSLPAISSPVELDRVVTIVNDGIILSSDIDSLNRTVILNAGSENLPDKAILEQQILDQLIFEELQLQEAKRLGIEVDDTGLTIAIDTILTNKKITLDELKIQLMRNNISWPNYREQIRKEVTISEVRNAQVRRRINILPQEIDAMVAQLNEQSAENIQYSIRHIQLPVAEDATKEEQNEQVELADQIFNQLKNGESANTLALTYSKGPRALNGGDWGWMRIEEMPTIFADQIKDHKKGSIIGPFKSSIGYHILKIDDVKGQESIAVTEVNARHILIKPSLVLSDEGAKRQLNEMIEQIRLGTATFEDLAKQHSVDPGSAIKGGELGWQTSDIFVPEFKYVVDNQPKGRVSGPFKTPHGWHIVEVLDRRQADGTEAAMKNRAYNILLNRKFNDETQTWLQELKAGAYIEQLEQPNDNNEQN